MPAPTKNVQRTTTGSVYTGRMRIKLIHVLGTGTGTWSLEDGGSGGTAVLGGVTSAASRETINADGIDIEDPYLTISNATVTVFYA